MITLHEEHIELDATPILTKTKSMFIKIDEVNEIDLLISELTWQLGNTLRMLSAHYDNISNKKISAPIAVSIKTIKKI